MSRIVAGLAILLGTLSLASPAGAVSVLPDLGDVVNFALLAQPDGSDDPTATVSSSSSVTGHIGVGPGGLYHKSGSGHVTGSVLLAPTATSTVTGPGFPGVLMPGSDLSGPIGDGLFAASSTALLAPDQTFASTLTSSTTLTRSADITVINAAGIDLSGSDTLTIAGGADDYFVINVAGAFEFSGSSQIAFTGGIDASHVLFNVTGTGAELIVSASSIASGTVLAPQRDFTVHGATFHGTVFANDLHISSGGTFNYLPFDVPQPPPPPPGAEVPEPGTAALLLFGLTLGPLALRRRHP